jgi:hypothetical protein
LIGKTGIFAQKRNKKPISAQAKAKETSSREISEPPAHYSQENRKNRVNF